MTRVRLENPVGRMMRARRYAWLVVAAALTGATIAYVAGLATSSTRYSASIRLRVDITNDSYITNSSDAAVDAARMVSPSVLHATADNLSTASRGDPDALHRVRCTADRADRFVRCSTTSGNRTAVSATLKDLAKTFIPLNVQQSELQYAQDLREFEHEVLGRRTKIHRLETRLARLRQVRHPGLAVRNQTNVAHLKIAQFHADIGQIQLREAAIRRQMVEVRHAVRIVGVSRSSNGSTGRLVVVSLIGAVGGAVVALSSLIVWPVIRRPRRASRVQRKSTSRAT